MLTEEGWWRVSCDQYGNVYYWSGPHRWKWQARLRGWLRRR